MFTLIFCVNQFKTSKGYMSIYIYIPIIQKGYQNMTKKLSIGDTGTKTFTIVRFTIQLQLN